MQREVQEIPALGLIHMSRVCRVPNARSTRMLMISERHASYLHSRDRSLLMAVFQKLSDVLLFPLIKGQNRG